MLAFINIRFNKYQTEAVAEAISAVPQVLETHHVAGEDCLMLKVRCRSPRELERVLERVWQNDGIDGTRTTIALSSYKETTVLPFSGCGEAGSPEELSA